MLPFSWPGSGWVQEGRALCELETLPNLQGLGDEAKMERFEGGEDVSLSTNQLLQFPQIQKRVIKALFLLMYHDGDLILRETGEPAITHKLAEHLQKEFRDFGDWLKVDCEYNRKGPGIESKAFARLTEKCPGETKEQRVRPDIIVHERGKPFNILAIEAKKSNSPGKECDKAKLLEFTSNTNFNYKFGLFLLFDMKQKGKVLLEWYKEGETSSEEKMMFQCWEDGR